MNRWAACLVAVTSLALLGACGGPTLYQPADDDRDGYSDQALEPGRYRVVFRGNSLTQRETVENYMLYRAAELTVAQGYDYFIVAERDTDRQTEYVGSLYGGPAFGFGRYGGWGWGGGGGIGIGLGTGDPIDSYASSVVIATRKGPVPEDNPQAYDAKAVIETLGPTIDRPAKTS